jgi:hypothetical protein
VTWGRDTSDMTGGPPEEARPRETTDARRYKVLANKYLALHQIEADSKAGFWSGCIVTTVVFLLAHMVGWFGWVFLLVALFFCGSRFKKNDEHDTAKRKAVLRYEQENAA